MFLPKYSKGFVPTPDGSRIPYLLVGRGPIQRVVIPGAGDGLAKVTEAALNLAYYYRKQAQRYSILIVSRRDPFPEGHGMESQGQDTILVMDSLNYKNVVLECNSAGGPVGQIIAALRPDLVSALVLSVTLHKSNPHTDSVVREWLGQIEQKRWSDFLWSTVEKTFVPKTVARYRYMKPLLSLLSSPSKNSERLRNILSELSDFDNSTYLQRIVCPTLVIGGEQDLVVPAAIQREMAALIPGAELVLFPDYGHGNDQENPEYPKVFERFVAGLI